MTSRERLLAAIHHEPVDRIPLDLWATPEIWRALLDHFGTEDGGGVRQELGLDSFAGPPLAYTGSDRTLPDGMTTGIWGARYRTIELPTGGSYTEQTYYPLKDATDIKALDDFNWENPADYDFEGAARWCREFEGDAILWAGYLAPFVDLWDLCGQETALMNLALHPEFMEAVLDRTMAYRLEQHRLLFEACGEYLDVTQVTDDFGCQNGLVMSHATIRRFFWPHYREAIKLAHRYDLAVFHHDDGGIGQIVPDLVEMGVAILNPVQWKCAHMDLTWLKREFGHALCFHGSVENQEILPFGTPEEVRAEVRKNINILASDGTGLILGPCHNIQSGTPVENVLALYDEARKWPW